MHNYNFFKEIVRTFLYNLIFVSHKDVLFIHNCIKQIHYEHHFFPVPETPLLQARVRAHGLQRLSPEDVATRLPLLHTGASVTKLFCFVSYAPEEANVSLASLINTVGDQG